MKAIFLDIDGTLVNYDTQIPKSAMSAVAETRKKGNKVYVTTGRSKAEMYEELWEIGLDGMIGGNGMYIEDNGKIIQDLSMKKEDVIQVIDWMKENDLAFYVESKNGLFGSEDLFSRMAQNQYGEERPEYIQKIKGVFPHMIFGEEFYRDDVAKISFCLYPDKLKEAQEKFGQVMKVSSWSGSGKKQEFGEFAMLGIDKVHAVSTLLDYLQIKKEDTFAFGDAESDRQMIEYCHVGVAMGNAEESLKKVADYVTEDVNENGLWNAFAKYNLV